MMRYLLIVMLLNAFTWAPPLLANDCGKWQSKLKATERKLNQGGNRSQERQWTNERDYYAGVVEQCQKKAGNYRWIETAHGASGTHSKSTRNSTSKKREKPRKIVTDNPELKQIIATCNYWIEQYNSAANDANFTFKNSACRHADQMTHEMTLRGNTGEPFTPSRPLKSCVKPNNKIDEDVKRCMQGQLEPVWNSHPQ